MVKITAAEVNSLRKSTGAGMMDCKRALVESEGDAEKAIEILRKKGQKVAAKRADKEANEGIVIARASEDNSYGTILMINCETDFVAKNQEFVDFANEVSNKSIELKSQNTEDILAATLGNGRTVQDNLTDMVGKIGEKIGLNKFASVEAAIVSAYNHQGNRLGTLVGFNKNDFDNAPEITREIAMQVAAMNPVAIDKGDMPQSVLDKEVEIGMEQARQEGKPEQMLEKIAMGKLNKFIKDNTLLNQQFVRDSKKTVGGYLNETSKDLTVTVFNRFMLG